MIILMHKRTIEETVTLIELDLWYHGRYQILMRIPVRMTEAGAESLKTDAERVIKKHFKDIFEGKEKE